MFGYGAPPPPAHFDTEPHYQSAVLQSDLTERARTYRADALSEDGEHIFLYFAKDSLLPAYGDTVLVYTRLCAPEPIGSFDYATYLLRQGITATGYVPKGQWLVLAPSQRPWYATAKGWQLHLKERYAELGISGQELATLSALTLGYREDLEKDIKRAFQTAGAMHVLAVSGLHTGILMSVLIALLTGFGYWRPLYDERAKQFLINGLIIIFLWCYAAVTGWSPSVVRSVIMCTLLLLAEVFHRQGISLNAVFAAAVFILLFRPMDLYSVSFQLSFAAVIAIIVFVPVFNSLLPVPYRLPYRLKKVLRYCRDLVTVSIAAQLGTLPFTLYYFGQFSTYFLLTNIVILPLAFVIMLLALITITLSAIPLVSAIPYLVDGLSWLLNASVYLLNHYVLWIESLPYAVITL